MTSDRTRRIAAATFALTAALGLTACGTGFDAQVNQPYQPGVGANLRSGDVQLFNALLVANDDETYSLSAGVLNASDEEKTVESATFAPLDGGGEPEQVEPSSELTVAATELRIVGQEGALAGLELPELREGRYATLTLTFTGGEEVTLEIPIVARTEEYASVARDPSAEDVETDLDNAGDASAEGTNP